MSNIIKLYINISNLPISDFWWLNVTSVIVSSSDEEELLYDSRSTSTNIYIFIKVTLKIRK
jgi:hypothetical protein